ncbi:VAMP-associated protein [Trametes coccinea BRFM310]|uniref:VAMP-associated protein n=1 Tax=Trametes coccinea (strain BRFM310) TaxID=1353009 RepID=A0A1Y2J1Z8_TRAC3|nr:VAMP-associated protein [Trametes coccinea BRFM310]
MSVSLNPSSVLGFNRPFTQSVKRTLQITNHNAQPVAFKVKTTAPKLYCVRPNSGRVEPGETVEVAVMLQAMKEDLPPNAKCKDKFLIQSTIITPEKESLPLADIWNGEGDEVHSQKIRVVYLPPEGQTVPEEDETHANMSSLLSVPGQDTYATVRQYPASNGHATREPSGGEESTLQPSQREEVHHDAPSTPPPNVTVHPPEPQPEEPRSDEGVGIVNVSVHAPPAHVSPPPSPPTRSAPLPDPNPELLKKLEEAKAEIERLRQIIASMPEPSTAPTTITTSQTELRSRRRAPYSDDGSSTYDGRTTYDDGRTVYDGQTDVGSYVGSEVPPPEGVPLQVVIIVALAVFVTTYLFF